MVRGKLNLSRSSRHHMLKYFFQKWVEVVLQGLANYCQYIVLHVSEQIEAKGVAGFLEPSSFLTRELILHRVSVSFLL